MFSVFDFVHYCMQNAEENKIKLELKLKYVSILVQCTHS